MVLGLFLVLRLRLLPVLLSALLVYELVLVASPLLHARLSNERARALVVALLSLLVVGILVALSLGALSLMQQDLGVSIASWQEQSMLLIAKAREQLPQSWVASLPGTVDELRSIVVEQLHKHAAALQLAGRETLRVLLQVLIGLALGSIISLTQAGRSNEAGPLSAALLTRTKRLASSFHDIVFAQFRISLLNTICTALLLLIIFPLAGVDLPFTKSLIVLTFLAGLLPVIGNLISNTAITVSALSISPVVGVAALVYLIVIHKVEYFLNARIVGSKIRARAWELLIAMLVMEAAFGLAGVIAAPIYYAYLKYELRAEGLI
ncbi:MAG: AI-2E family transporter [Pseudoxanthomonas sp.]